MGRHISSSAATNVTATRVAPPGYMGEFGTGLYRAFLSGGTFTVPAGVTKIRVRVVGGGGAGKGGNSPFYSGAGGGYAHGVFDVTPGQSYGVTVGQGGYGGFTGSDGGSSSFGSLISATGGKGGGAASGGAVSGGVGVGGDFQASGGNGSSAGGGGAAGSQLGNGGVGSAGGAAVGGIGSIFQNGASPFGASYSAGGPDVTGVEEVGVGANGAVNRISAAIRFPFDGFTGGGGTYNGSGPAGKGGPGAGGGAGAPGGEGGVGGGGGSGNVGAGGYGGKGGIGGGGGAGANPDKYGGDGGNGIVIVEW